MGIFRDAYVGALAEEGSPWVNRSALFFEQLRIHGGDAEGILRRLFNFETKERIVAGRNVFEVINGPFRPESGRVFSSSTNQEDGSPAIVICGSGMTTHGAFQRYLRNHYGDSFATVVISGYVPSGSPGALLGEVANVAGNEQGRAGITLKIKATKQDPELVLSGSDVKSAYDSVADLYSGHADGASICRYVLKDKECAGRLRRVFLVHGEDHSRNGLKGMFEDEMASLVPSANSGASVECPRSDSPWFDCEKDEWEAQAPLKTSQSVLVPTSCSPDEILGLVRSAFLPHELAEGGLNLKFRASSSKISLRVKAFNAESHKLIVDTVYNGLSDLLEAGRVSFRWREVLNILGLQKAEHFAGHKLCTCEEEFQEFEAVRRPLVHGGKQRLNGFVLAGREAFQPEEMSALELLLTPHVPVFVLDNNYLSRINAALFSSAREKMSKKAAFYVPIQLGQPFIPISRPFDGLCLRALLSRVSDDAKIKDERLPASPISAASGSLAVAAPGFDKSRKGVPKDRLDVPSSDYERLIKGVPITAKVESRFANGKGYKLRVEGSRALGVIYEGSLVSEAPLTIGEIREVCLVELDAKNKKAVFVLARQRNRNREADIESILANPTYGTLAGLFGIPFRHFMDLLGDYCKDVLLDEQKVAQDDKIQEDPVLIYDRFAGGLDHDNAIRSSAPRHEPFTFAKMAGVLGEHWTYEGVLRALEIFKTSEQSELREITDIILRASSEGGPDRVFPLEQKDLFYAACVEFSNNGWKGDPAIKSEPPARQLPAPSYYTVQELSESWSCSSGHLLAEAVKLDLPIRAEVVVSVHDAQKLSASKTQEPSQ